MCVPEPKLIAARIVRRRQREEARAGIISRCYGCSRIPRPNRRFCDTCTLKRKLYPMHLSSTENERALLAFKIFDGHCQCCGSTEPGKRDWCLDHCHETGAFRGIICTQCNVMLGMAKNNPAVLAAGITYLDRSSANGEGSRSDMCSEAVLDASTEIRVA